MKYIKEYIDFEDWDEEEVDPNTFNLKNNIVRIGGDYYIKQDDNHLYNNYEYNYGDLYWTIVRDISKVKNVWVKDTYNQYPDFRSDWGSWKKIPINEL